MTPITSALINKPIIGSTTRRCHSKVTQTTYGINVQFNFGHDKIYTYTHTHTHTHRLNLNDRQKLNLIKILLPHPNPKKFATKSINSTTQLYAIQLSCL